VYAQSIDTIALRYCANQSQFSSFLTSMIAIASGKKPTAEKRKNVIQSLLGLRP